MNFLAKHFFDYQSFVNLPYKAVQLHKTPVNEAGADSAASWAPKSMQLAGKNQPAPGARANRNNVELRPGGHRHGRPSKLEFRSWGDRHGELHPEKNVAHKDAWMVPLDGEFRHFCDSDEDLPSLADFLPKLSLVENTPYQILTILTYAPQVEFITLTLKKLRGLAQHRSITVKVQLFEGHVVLEERQSLVSRLPPEPPGAGPQRVANHVDQPNAALMNHVEPNHVGGHGPPHQHILHHAAAAQRPRTDPSLGLRSRHRRETRPSLDEDVHESFMLHASPHRLAGMHIAVQVFAGEEDDVLGDKLGHCLIGFVDGSTKGVYHWRQMIRKHGTPCCMWHRLAAPARRNSAT